MLHQNIENSPLNSEQRLPRRMNPTEVVFSRRDLQFNPLFLNYKVHFIYQLSSEDGPSKVVTDSYNFNDKKWEEKTAIGNIGKNVCSTILHCFGNLTVFGCDSDEVALYSLIVKTRSWQFVKSSKFSFLDLNFKNSVCAHYAIFGKDRVVAITVLQASFLIYQFSPEKDVGTNWKSAMLLLPHLQGVEAHYQIQSCVVNANNIYFSLLSKTHLFVYQIDLSPLEQNRCSSLAPKYSWCLENFNIKKCFLSLLDDDVVTIMIKGAINGNVVEVSYLYCFNSGSLNPLIVYPSIVEVITSAVVPDTTNIAILCRENNEHKLHLLNGKRCVWIGCIILF